MHLPVSDVIVVPHCTNSNQASLAVIAPFVSMTPKIVEPENQV